MITLAIVGLNVWLSNVPVTPLLTTMLRASGSVTALANCSVPAAEKVRVPLSGPSAASELMFNMPAAMVVPPE